MALADNDVLAQQIMRDDVVDKVLKRDLPIDDPDVLDSIDVLASETVRRSGKQYTSECLLKE